MFKLNFCIFLIFNVLLSTGLGTLTFNNLQEKLVLKLIKVKPKTNLVGSSLFVRFSLCKLASVATGETKEELMTVLGFREDSMVNNCYPKLKEYMTMMRRSDLTIINKLYVNYTEDIDPSFFSNSSDKFGVQVEKVGFNYPKAAISYINRLGCNSVVGIGALSAFTAASIWEHCDDMEQVASSTYKRIVDILEPNDITNETMMIIVNGAHFKGTWEFPFDHRLTKLMPFHHLENKITKVPMMTKFDDFMFTATGNVKAFNIKFGCMRSSITFVVPNNVHELPNVIEQMEKDPKFVLNLVKNMKSTPMQILIPRIKIKTYIDWTGFLQELGLYGIFDRNSSELSILKEGSRVKNIALNKIKQKLFIQIDELGVARFTHDPLMHRGEQLMPIIPDVRKFTVDKPFYFQVTAEIDGIRYDTFSGVYYGPELSSIDT